MKTEVFLSSEDANELQDIANKAFGSTRDSTIEEWFSFPEMLIAIAHQRGVCVRAVSDEGKPLGFVYAQQESPINGKEGLEKWVIVITAVYPGSVGQGVGSLLLKAIEKEATARNASKMFVYTNKGDDKVIGFYQKRGYSDAGWVKDYQYGKDNSAVFLLKHLS